MAKTLLFREDGTFKIVQFTDPEFATNDMEEQQMEAMMLRIIQAEQPDLVVFTGDIIASASTPDPAAAFRRACSVPERLNTPWAAVFGNHDSEGTITREQLHAMQLTYSHNYAKPDPQGVHGSGNYVLTVKGKDGEAASALYFLDSGSYSPLEYSRMGFYDWVRRDQIDWYARESYRLTSCNGGTPLPSLAFFHIPLPEYNDVWDFSVCYGERNGEFCCAPWVNSGLFAAMIEMGDVMGTSLAMIMAMTTGGIGMASLYAMAVRRVMLTWRSLLLQVPESLSCTKDNDASTLGCIWRVELFSPSRTGMSQRDELRRSAPWDFVNS